jgi:AAA+ lid domain
LLNAEKSTWTYWPAALPADTTHFEAMALQCINYFRLSDDGLNRGAPKLPRCFVAKVRAETDRLCVLLHYVHIWLMILRELPSRPAFHQYRPTLTQRPSGTPGFSGADLANMVKEAALAAARQNRKAVLQYDFELAKDKVLMGVERQPLLLTDEEKRNTAYHEADAVVAAKMRHSDTSRTSRVLTYYPTLEKCNQEVSDALKRIRQMGDEKKPKTDAQKYVVVLAIKLVSAEHLLLLEAMMNDSHTASLR